VPLLDGNVERVLLRLHANDAPPKDKATQDWAWAQAEALVGHAEHPGVLNEGLMELGATVCTPSSPKCPRCPLREHCGSFAQGRTEEIPTPKPRAKQKDWFIVCFVVDDAGRILIETRGSHGLWAGMAQPPSAESGTEFTLAAAAAVAGVEPIAVIDRFTHFTTHRRVAFTVATAQVPSSQPTGRQWVSRETLATLALSNAHRRVFGLS
jgi:A/G-specific adenine glycosylase